MKKCNCKIRNTLGKYQKIWPWIGVTGLGMAMHVFAVKQPKQ